MEQSTTALGVASPAPTCASEWGVQNPGSPRLVGMELSQMPSSAILDKLPQGKELETGRGVASTVTDTWHMAGFGCPVLIAASRGGSRGLACTSECRVSREVSW